MHASTMCVPAAFVLAMNACSSIHPLNSADIPVNGKVITEQMIAETSASTAWDVIEQSGFFRMMNDPATGRAGRSPSWVTSSEIARPAYGF